MVAFFFASRDLVANEQVTKIVMQVFWFPLVRISRDQVDIDIDGHKMLFMPDMEFSM